MAKKLLSLSLLFAFLFYVLNLFAPPFGIRINLSESLPCHLLWGAQIKPENIEKGMFIAFSHPMYKSLVAKKITGISGDVITVRNSQLYINDIPLGAILRENSKGKALTPIKEGTIAEGFYFVQGLHDRSFDSRYEEFGLIPIDSIKERLWPIF